MKKDLDLIEYDRDGVRGVKWNDINSEPHWKEKIRFVLFLLVLFIGIGIIIDSNIEIFGVIIVIGAIWYSEKYTTVWEYSEKSVMFHDGIMNHNGNKHDISKISRIEYGRGSDWGKQQDELAKKMQIRVWFNDEFFLVIGQNQWTAADNHQIHAAIMRAFTASQRPPDKKQAATPKPPRQNAPTGKPRGKFGVPDY